MEKPYPMCFYSIIKKRNNHIYSWRFLFKQNYEIQRADNIKSLQKASVFQLPVQVLLEVVTLSFCADTDKMSYMYKKAFIQLIHLRGSWSWLTQSGPPRQCCFTCLPFFSWDQGLPSFHIPSMAMAQYKHTGILSLLPDPFGQSRLYGPWGREITYSFRGRN